MKKHILLKSAGSSEMIETVSERANEKRRPEGRVRGAGPKIPLDIPPSQILLRMRFKYIILLNFTANSNKMTESCAYIISYDDSIIYILFVGDETPEIADYETYVNTF